MKKEELQEKTDWLLAETEAKGFNNKLYIDWGVDLLNAGYDLDELAILAGLDGVEHFEIKKYFELSAERLGLSLVCGIDKMLEYLKKAMREAIEGAKEIDEVLKIAFHLNYTCDYEDGDLCYLVNISDYWEIMEVPNGASESGFQEYVKNEFKLYLENNK